MSGLPANNQPHQGPRPSRPTPETTTVVQSSIPTTATTTATASYPAATPSATTGASLGEIRPPAKHPTVDTRASAATIASPSWVGPQAAILNGSKSHLLSGDINLSRLSTSTTTAMPSASASSRDLPASVTTAAPPSGALPSTRFVPQTSINLGAPPLASLQHKSRLHSSPAPLAFTASAAATAPGSAASAIHTTAANVGVVACPVRPAVPTPPLLAGLAHAAAAAPPLRAKASSVPPSRGSINAPTASIADSSASVAARPAASVVAPQQRTVSCHHDAAQPAVPPAPASDKRADPQIVSAAAVSSSNSNDNNRSLAVGSDGRGLRSLPGGCALGKRAAGDEQKMQAPPAVKR